MPQIPDISGEYRNYEFDKDAQGAYEYYFKVEQTGNKISLYDTVHDPYNRENKNTLLKVK